MLNKVKFPGVFLGTNPEGEMQKMEKLGRERSSRSNVRLTLSESLNQQQLDFAKPKVN